MWFTILMDQRRKITWSYQCSTNEKKHLTKINTYSWMIRRVPAVITRICQCGRSERQHKKSTVSFLHISGNAPTRIWSIHVQQGCQDNATKKGISLQQMMLSQLDIHAEEKKNQRWPLTHTIHGLNAKWLTALNVKWKTVGLLGEKHAALEQAKVS